MTPLACFLSHTQCRFVGGFGGTHFILAYANVLSSVFVLSLTLFFSWVFTESPKNLQALGVLAAFISLHQQSEEFPLFYFKRERECVCVMCIVFPSNLIECNCPRISKHWMVWREGLIAFQTELRFPNVSFSVCNYLKPYLNPIKEHTILIVICTNAVFAIVIAAMCVWAPINIPLENAVVASHVV